MTPPEWGQLLLLGLIWGSSFYFGELTLREWPLQWFIFARTCIAAAMLWVIMRLQGHRLPACGMVWRDWVIMGLINIILPFSLIFWGQAFVGAGLASLLNSTTPLFSAALGHWYTRQEPLTPLRVLGLLLGIGGVGAIAGPEAMEGNLDAVIGALAVVIGAGLYAVAGLWGRRFVHLPSTVTATGSLICTAATLLPVILIVSPPWHMPMPSATLLVAVLALGVLCTGIAYLLYFALLQSAGPTNTLLVTLLIPLSALMLATLLLGERFTPVQGLGMALTLGGLGVIAWDTRRASRPHTP